MNNYIAETESLIIINISEDHFSAINSMLGLQSSNNITARSVCGLRGVEGEGVWACQDILCMIKPILDITKKVNTTL